MSPELHILRDLAAGRSTADSIAGRLGLRTDAVQVILGRQQAAGLVANKPLECLTVWQLTDAGKASKPTP